MRRCFRTEETEKKSFYAALVNRNLKISANIYNQQGIANNKHVSSFALLTLCDKFFSLFSFSPCSLSKKNAGHSFL